MSNSDSKSRISTFTSFEFVKALQGELAVNEIGEQISFLFENGLKKKEVIITNIKVEESIAIESKIVFPYPIKLKECELNESFIIVNGIFEDTFRIESGNFHGNVGFYGDERFHQDGGIFKKGFYIEGGNFNGEFNIEQVDFQDSFIIYNGNFNEDFAINGGNFKSGFTIYNGHFSKDFSISLAVFNDEFLISSGEFKERFDIGGGEFKNGFRIKNGEFLGGFEIGDYTGGLFYKQFVMRTVNLKTLLSIREDFRIP